MNDSHNIIKDEWLAGVLNRPAFRFNIDNDCKEDYHEKATGYRCEMDRIMAMPHVFIYSKVSPLKLKWVSFLEENGFRLVDTNVLLSRPRSPRVEDNGNNLCRFAVDSDEDGTVKLAGHAFIYSRFHQDPLFNKETANQIKSEWARNYFKGNRGDYMVVAVVNGRVVGFLQLLVGLEKNLVIDLITVDELHRRQGIARKMIEFAHVHCGDCGRIDVGTQIANTASLQAYESMGFRFRSASYVFHYHGS
jgi:ribosomal protein S18 acetylase RimI-like enzyme